MPCRREFEAEREILDDARSRSSRDAEQRERHGHTRPGEMNPARHSLEPALPDEVIAGTRDRYVAAYERLTRRSWEASA